MKLKALERLQRLRVTLQTHAKHALRAQQTDLAEVEAAQRAQHAALETPGQTLPGTLLHELEQVSQVLAAQARTVREKVQEAQALHDARARDTKQIERLVTQAQEAKRSSQSQQERESLEDWLRNHPSEEP